MIFFKNFLLQDNKVSNFFAPIRHTMSYGAKVNSSPLHAIFLTNCGIVVGSSREEASYQTLRSVFGAMEKGLKALSKQYLVIVNVNLRMFAYSFSFCLRPTLTCYGSKRQNIY